MTNQDYIQRIDYLIQMANVCALALGVLFGYLFGALTYIAAKRR